MNPDKTQVIWLGSRQQLTYLNNALLHLLNGTVIIPISSVRNLGLTFDHTMTMAEHVNNTIRTCLYQKRQLRSVKYSLSDHAIKMFIQALVSSR